MSRRNYVSSRLEYFKSNRIKQIENHNTRKSSIDYLLDEQHHIYDNENIVYNQDNTINTDGKTISSSFEESLLLKQETAKKHKQYQKNGNEIIEIVVSLSEEQSRHYLDKNIPLMNGYKQYMEDVHNKWGFKPISINLHTDEGHIDIETGKVKYNIHAHCTFHNYDFEKEKTVLRTLRRQDFRDLQDLSANSFKKVGLDFVRGEAKELTGAKHLKRNEWVSKQQNELIKRQGNILLNQGVKLSANNQELQEKEILLLNTQGELLQKVQELDKTTTTLVKSRNLLKKQYTEHNKLKNEYKSLRSNYTKDDIKYKELTIKMNEAKELEENLRKEWREAKKDLINIESQQKNLEKNIGTLEDEYKKIQELILEDESKKLNLTNEIHNLELTSRELKTMRSKEDVTEYMTEDIDKFISENFILKGTMVKDKTVFKDNLKNLLEEYSEFKLELDKDNKEKELIKDNRTLNLKLKSEEDKNLILKKQNTILEYNHRELQENNNKLIKDNDNLIQKVENVNELKDNIKELNKELKHQDIVITVQSGRLEKYKDISPEKIKNIINTVDEKDKEIENLNIKIEDHKENEKEKDKEIKELKEEIKELKGTGDIADSF